MNNCPVCKTSKFHKHLIKIGHDNIFTCTNCGLGITVGEPFDISTTPAPLKDESLISLMIRRMLMSYEFGFLTRRNKLQIFEIGSGNGDLAKYLTSQGHKVMWSDADPNYRNTIKARFDVDAVEFDPLKNSKSFEKKYDIVVLRHVFEHFDDPRTALSNIKKLLKPSGDILILGPNFASWSRTVSQEKWTWNLPEHRFHWNSKAITLLLEEFGFQILEVRGVFSPFGLPLCLGKNLKPPILRKLLFPFTFLIGILLEFLAVVFRRSNNILVIGRIVMILLLFKLKL